MKLKVEQEANNYINASLIQLDLGPEDSLGPKEYIATQGPTRDTSAHFWQMVYGESTNEYDTDTVVILMLTPVHENGNEACAPYWPAKVGATMDIPADEHFLSALSVSCIKSEDSVNALDQEENQYPHTTTELQLRCEQTGVVKTIFHVYVDTWVDFDRPKAHGDIFSLVRLVNSLQSKSATPEGKKPMPLIVHCSAGVGRTGTYLALDYMWTRSKLLGSGPRSPPTTGRDLIYDLVLSMREQRMGMVQRFSQYNYIYENVRMALSSTGQ